MIWGVLAVLSLVFIAAVLVPPRMRRRTQSSLTLYKDQLRELESDLSNGLIDKDQAHSTRLEIERRILRLDAAAAENTSSQSSSRAGIMLYGALTAVGIAGSLWIYLQTGSHDAPAAPAPVIALSDQPIQEGGPTLREAIAQVKARLRDNPDDTRGWEVLAISARAAADLHTVEQAYGRLMELEPEEPQWAVQRLETMLVMASGSWHPALRLALDGVVKAHGDHPAAYFYMGQFYKDTGNTAGAIQVWSDLLERTDAQSGLARTLQNELAQLKGEDIAQAPSGLPQVSEADREAVMAMSPEDQQAFIAGMIDRLATRLAENPDDVRGWEMLSRAYVQVGKRDEAIAALTDALDTVSAQYKPDLERLLDKLRSNEDFIN